MKYSLFSRVSIGSLLCILLCISVLAGFSAQKSVAPQTTNHQLAVAGGTTALQCDIGPGIIFYIFDLVQSVLVPDRVPARHDFPNLPHGNGHGPQ